MSLLVKKGNNGLFSDFFKTDSLLSSNFFDFGADMAGLNDLFVIPNANIAESQKDYRIELATPGLEKKDFVVEVESGVLTVSAQKQEEKNEDQKNYKRKEFSYQSFKRSFVLPDNCVTDQIDAKYDNGILHIVLPKKEITISNPKKEIKVA